MSIMGWSPVGQSAEAYIKDLKPVCTYAHQDAQFSVWYVRVLKQKDHLVVSKVR